MEGLGSFKAWCSCASGNSTTSCSLFDGACGPRYPAGPFCFSYWIRYIHYPLGTSVSWFWASERTSTVDGCCWERAEEGGEACSVQAVHNVIAHITLILNTTSASLADTRFLFILLVGYADVFRITKILSLRVKDIIILDDFMKINLIKRKNDQYRNGHISVLAMWNSRTFRFKSFWIPLL